jgi:hypothetical protein
MEKYIEDYCLRSTENEGRKKKKYISCEIGDFIRVMIGTQMIRYLADYSPGA